MQADNHSLGGDLPLSGITVIDFTRILSGPYATMLLADLGADVIKVERAGHGDETRNWGPPFWRGTSTYFAAINRGKRSLAVDLGSSAGRELVQDLIAGADVVVENFRPGVTSRLGISYAQVSAQNAGLVYASITGFGVVGPRAEEAGTEVIVEAHSGLMAMMGMPGGPPVRFGVAMVDIATGMALVNGVLAALLTRSRTGCGRRLEFPLYSTAISVMATVIASACVSPESQNARVGSGHPSIVPYCAFEGCDGWCVLGAVNEGMWRRLCAALELDDLVEHQRARTNEDRVGNREFVEGAIAAAVKERRVEEITRRLGEHGVLVAPVKTALEAIGDPQTVALDLLEAEGDVMFARTPMSQFNPGRLSPAPQLGADSLTVLQEAGVSEARIDLLLHGGVISTSPSMPAASDRNDDQRQASCMRT